MQASSTTSSLERNKQILEKFIHSIKSEVTQINSIDYLNAYMRYWLLYEEGEGEELLDGQGGNKEKKQKQKQRGGKKLVYRYDWLLDEARKGDDNIQTLQDKIIQFVIYKKKMGLGANGIVNYISPLRKFYWVNGIKGIDWELVRTYKPENVKKTPDREYYPEEVIAIEDKLDVRGKVISGMIRGSGVRRGAEPSINVGDLIPLQTKYGKIYKIWVYRGTSDMYATACIPEVAARIDAYFEYRMRFGEVCKQCEKEDEGEGDGGGHLHEYHDGNGGEVIQKWFKANMKHLDSDAPLIREELTEKIH